jgi:hypothetical protein
MAGKGSSGKSSYGKHGVGHKTSGPALPTVHKPHGPSGGGRAGNVRQPAKSTNAYTGPASGE